MEYGKVKGIEKRVSRIIYGCTTEVMMKGEDASALLDEVYALGINTFDTAENYGLSEVSLGNWIKARGNRDDVVIITKGCHPYDGVDRLTVEYLKMDIEQSFERLGTDYIDIIEQAIKDGKISEERIEKPDMPQISDVADVEEE